MPCSTPGSQGHHRRINMASQSPTETGCSKRAARTHKALEPCSAPLACDQLHCSSQLLCPSWSTNLFLWSGNDQHHTAPVHWQYDTAEAAAGMLPLLYAIPQTQSSACSILCLASPLTGQPRRAPVLPLVVTLCCKESTESNHPAKERPDIVRSPPPLHFSSAASLLPELSDLIATRSLAMS